MIVPKHTVSLEIGHILSLKRIRTTLINIVFRNIFDLSVKWTNYSDFLFHSIQTHKCLIKVDV